MKILNTELMSNPMNWLIVTMMALLGLMLATTLATAVRGNL